ncbi:hypothetical protein JOC78_003314 [Bacillus ectoiniformans]|uniref:sigma factor G inhibitor Gin n=1 Tax=Bacillus ectoiniformans TaxID=1494429 RepID=UPI00195801A1|nr:sigma factor G inhibitor Gin [Bacillus ectoiniformans]MBM7650328.1 hypothetical protein [Bacillus ectoiniformans]
MEKQEVKSSCIICDQEKAEGIYIYTSFVCHECQQEMVEADPADEAYRYYIDKLKKIGKPTVYS